MGSVMHVNQSHECQTHCNSAVQAFGEIRSLYTGCKQRGLVTVNYFDLRAACLALHSLAGTAALGDATLDVQYPVPSEQTVADREDVRPSQLPLLTCQRFEHGPFHIGQQQSLGHVIRAPVNMSRLARMAGKANS